jgi:hypothetical protein
MEKDNPKTFEDEYEFVTEEAKLKYEEYKNKTNKEENEKMNNNKPYNGVEGSNEYISVQDYIFKQVFQSKIESTRNLIVKKVDEELAILSFKCANAKNEEEWRGFKDKYSQLVEFKCDLRDTDRFLTMNLKGIRGKFEYVELPKSLLELTKIFSGGIEMRNSDIRGFSPITDKSSLGQLRENEKVVNFSELTNDPEFSKKLFNEVDDGVTVNVGRDGVKASDLAASITKAINKASKENKSN